MSDAREVFISVTCEGERCFCGLPAVRKVGEEIAYDDPLPHRHNLTSYVCAEHFTQIMGPCGARDVGLTSSYSKRTPGGEAGLTKAAVMNEAHDRFSHSEDARYGFIRGAEWAANRPAGESAGVSEALERLDMAERSSGHSATVTGLMRMDARAIVQALAARASQPSAGEVGG